MADIALRDPLAGLTSILDLYNGKTTISSTSTSGGTSTSSTASNLTTDQLNSQIAAAMAPLSNASHGAGLSTYSDTSLALGRAQVAADTAAKYAGSTTTNTIAPTTNTTTTKTPGALSSTNIGSTLKGLALTQGASYLKKAIGKTGITDAISGKVDTTLDSILSPVSNFLGGTSGVASAASSGGTNLFANDTVDSFSNVGGGAFADTVDLGISALGDTASSVASGIGDAASSLSDTASNVGSSISDWFSDLFAEGGLVIKKSNRYAEGGMVDDTSSDVVDDNSYASGGYLDRHVANSNLVDQSKQVARILANGDIAPKMEFAKPASVSDIVNSTVADYIGGSGNNAGTVSGNTSTADMGRYASSLKKDLTDTTPANVALSAIGMVGPLGSLVSNIVSKLTDVPTMQALAMNTLTNSMTDTAALDAQLSMNANYDSVDVSDTTPDVDTAQSVAANTDTENTGTGGSGTNSGGTKGYGDRGPGGSSGESGAAAGGASASGPGGYDSGGKVSGPGSATSDSVAAHLSDGEYVIDAKTVAALGPEFFQAIQAKFNPSAIASQKAKGRI